MTTRLVLGAIILAQVAHAQSVAKPALATRTVVHETETGSWRSGDAIVWVRVAPTGAISVYASHGYRSAFAHAIIITPEDVDKWADLGDHVLAGQATNGAIMLADSDLALEPGHAGDSLVLTVRLGGVRPDGITFLMSSASLREVTPVLRATAKASRATQTATAAPPAPVAPAPAAPASAAPTPAAPPAATPHTSAVTPATPVVVAVAPPEVATPDTPAPAPAPEAEVEAPVATAPVAAPTVTENPVAPVATITPAQFATVKVAKVTKVKLVPQSPVSVSLRRTSAGSIAKPTAAPVKTDETTDATKLAGSTVANLVKQWQSQLDLCYTEYGLKVNPALTGTIAVRLAIRPSGDVGAATFMRHNWSGAGGKEAESCMRGRVMAWMFPPASTPSAHEFTVAFAP